MPIETLVDLFLEAASHDKPDCMMEKVGGAYRAIPTSELVDRVLRLAMALRSLGVSRGDRVALMAENGPHWPTVDFATLGLGAILVPVYPTLPPNQATYVINDSGAKVLVVEEHETMAELLERREEMPAVEHYVAIRGDGGPETTGLDELLLSAEPDRASFEESAKQCKPDDVATFIYTSGTTGKPKGVMLSHGNIASNVVDVLKVFPIKPEYTTISFLPLSHSFERTVDYIYFYLGCSVAYAESVNTLAENLIEVRPNLFVSVPRVYEKVLAKVYENVASGPGIKRKIFAWAEKVAKASLPYRLRHETPGGWLGLKLKIADHLVFGKIRERLGGRFIYALSGGAPLSQDLAEFFWGIGVPIYEGYGLTETSPVISVNTPEAVKLGTVGRPIPNVEVKIAEDGEILARGPNIMKGYYNLEHSTANAIDGEGWFHTGDIGVLDPDGFLKITDRKKELIVNAYGKNLAPAPIENSLKASRFIAEAMVIGDRRKFLSALLVPDFASLKPWAMRHGISDTSPEALVANPEIHELIQKEIDTLNEGLAHHEQVRAWRLLPQEFSIEGGELTPTQKIKRRVVLRKYDELIDEMYEQAERLHPSE